MNAGENILAVALAAGLPLPHSCRAGRCASCKARLLAGEIAYPAGVLPPGIVAAEAGRGEVLLCQAQPRSDLVIETRRVLLSPTTFAKAELVTIETLPLRVLRVRVRLTDSALSLRPGQFIDLRNPAGDQERLAVVGVSAAGVDLEAHPDDSALRHWLDGRPQAGSPLLLAGPFDSPR